MATNIEDAQVFLQPTSFVGTAQFTNVSTIQLQSYSGAAAFNGWSTTGVSARRQVPAVPTLAELTDCFKTLLHDLQQTK